MPKEHGCHPDEHVMGPLSCASHILRNPVNNVLSIIEPPGARGVECSGPLLLMSSLAEVCCGVAFTETNAVVTLRLSRASCMPRSCVIWSNFLEIRFQILVSRQPWVKIGPRLIRDGPIASVGAGADRVGSRWMLHQDRCSMRLML